MIRIFTLLLAVFAFSAINAQEVIWGGAGDPNGEFDGGINDWTTIGYSNGLENEFAVFNWRADAGAYDGAFYGTRGPITSASAANGAMVFDSDFLDNDGDNTNFGGGLAPAPQLGYLISPVIDLTGQDQVAIQFTEYFRKFTGSITTVEVTTDGENWISYALPVNDAVAVNAETATNQSILIDVTKDAANAATFQFRFVFNANYYFWIIDDVAVVVTPNGNPQVGTYYYPMNGSIIPLHSVSTDTMSFWVAVKNGFGADPFDGTAYFKINDPSGTEVYSISQDFTGIDTDTFQIVEFDETVLPADVYAIFTTTGDYTFEYSIERTDGGVDYYASDNFGTERFSVTNNVFGINNAGGSGFGFTGGSSKPLSLYKTSDLPDGWKFVASKVLNRIFNLDAPDPENDLMNAEYEAILYKISDDIVEDFSNMNPDESIENDPDFEPVGYGYGALVDYDGAAEFAIDEGLFDFVSNEDSVTLEPNSRYFIYFRCFNIAPASGNLFSYIGTNINFYQQLSWISDDTGKGPITDSTVPGRGWALKLQVDDIQTPDGLDKNILDNVTLELYPNPTTDYVNINVELPAVEDKTTFVLRNMAGQVLAYQTLYDLQSGTHTFNVSEYPAGQYTVQILTKDGLKAEKFTIVR